jgi:ketosteroid isomerase-like protein
MTSKATLSATVVKSESHRNLRERRASLFANVDGDTTIGELHSISTTNEGAQFANNYCWVCRFDGDEIVEVRACLDSMMAAYTIFRNEIAARLIEHTPIAT